MGKRKQSDHSQLAKKICQRTSLTEVVTNGQPKVEVVVKRNRKISLSKNETDINIHVLQLIVQKIGLSSGLLRLAALNAHCRDVVGQEIAHFKVPEVDVSKITETKRLLFPNWYTTDNHKQYVKFHNDVREVINLLTQLSEIFPNEHIALKNFSPNAIGWFYPGNENTMPRCPPLLQKKIATLIRTKFESTTEFIYHVSLLRPSRFVGMFKHRLETITKLDLNDMKPLKSVGLRKEIFPFLTNLTELVWHAAEMWFIDFLPHPQELKSLCITLSLNGLHGDIMAKLINCKGLKQLHTGIHRPPMNRFVWTVALRSYQSFWNKRNYKPELLFQGIETIELSSGNDKAETYKAFPNLEKISFWDVPEYLFVTMAKEQIRYKEVQFGLLTQDLQSLCSFDSLMQALFKYLQPQNVFPFFIDNLKLNLHSMPVVALDYYLPNLMDSLGKCLPGLKTLELFVHCLIAGSSMPSSWLLDKCRPKKPEPKFEELEKFSFFIDGPCVVDDLDTYLPPTIQSISLSFNQTEKCSKLLKSLLKFIECLGDINRFPDLDELHIQVWGFACFEPIANAIVDHIPSLRRISIITLPINKNRNSTIDLINCLVEKSPKLTELCISLDMVNFLLSNEKIKTHWEDVLLSLHICCKLPTRCSLMLKTLPETNGWDKYIVRPYVEDIDLSLEEEESDKEESNEDEDSDADSFVVDSDEEHSIGSEDDLDAVEQALEEEDKKSQHRWEKKLERKRLSSDCSSAISEDGSDVIIFRKKRPGEVISSEEEVEDEEEIDREKNFFIDDEAEEVNDESDVDDESEPEGEDIVQSDDEELFVAQAELVNARPRRRSVPTKARRIIESDED